DLEGEYRICVEVDYDNYVEELDEENNKYCTSLLFEIKESVEGEAASLPVELWANASTLAKGQLTKPMIAPVAIGNQAPPRYVSSSSLWLVRFT
ncbi:MAG: hypothetical protein GWN86_15845, partial [Desulfobacterales bacterium]|nr:hypothetical protein [Desulfobacterales bacterium]